MASRGSLLGCSPTELCISTAGHGNAVNRKGDKFPPLTLAPPVLRTIGRFNPFAYAVDAARHLFTGNLTDVSVAQGFGLMAGLMILALLWGVRSFKRATA